MDDGATLETALEDTCTLLCVRDDGVAPVVDLTPWTDLSLLRRRAHRLLREHASCVAVELWRDRVLVERVERA